MPARDVMCRRLQCVPRAASAGGPAFNPLCRLRFEEEEPVIIYPGVLRNCPRSPWEWRRKGDKPCSRRRADQPSGVRRHRDTGQNLLHPRTDWKGLLKHSLHDLRLRCSVLGWFSTSSRAWKSRTGVKVQLRPASCSQRH